MKIRPSKPLGEMTLEEKVDWAAGNIALSLADGKFKESVTEVLLAIMQETYSRGFKAGLNPGSVTEL